MNVPKFVSPSALAIWLGSQEQYFLKYLAVDKPPRMLQNQAMSVGSSFDAYVKSYLYQRLFGKEQAIKDGFDFDCIFEKQVEPQNWDFAKKAGAVCFIQYKSSGALTHLFEALSKSIEPPMMEFTAMGTPCDADDHGKGIYNVVEPPAGVDIGPAGPVVLLGKPDLYFKHSDIDLTYDFKVNGYCSKTGKGPLQGYLYLLEGFEPKTKNHGRIHTDAVPYEEKSGFHYSLHPNVQMYEPSWARQLLVYSWICGAKVGSPIVIGIDQLCCKPSYPQPNISVALHRCTVTEQFQIETYKMFQHLWDVIHSDHIFRDLPKEQSQERVDTLLGQAKAYEGDDDNTKWLKSLREKGR